ncbi:MAG: hypothetical protein QMC36_08190 [Patescibacteria group bacterium]
MKTHELHIPEASGIRTLDLSSPSGASDVSGIVAVASDETLVAVSVPQPGIPVSYRFELAEGAKLFLRTLVRPGASADFSVYLNGDRSEADVRAVAVSENGHAASYSSKTVTSASKTRASSNVAAFSLPGGDLSVTTVAEIGEGVFGAYAEAVQSNVLF